MAGTRKNISKEILEIMLPMVRFSLRIGEWKRLFHIEEYKLIIVTALNYCVFYKNEKYHDGFEVDIAGYLIDENNIYLLLRIEHNRVGKMLGFFCERIRDEIKAELEKSGRHLKAKSISKETPEFSDHELFKKYPFNNCLLEKLMTAQKIHLAYYSPHVALMEERVHNNRFCSAIDYMHGDGPVLVTKLIYKTHCYDTKSHEEDKIIIGKTKNKY